MVMAAVSVCQQFSGELSHEAGEAMDDASADATALHERLVAYVHALTGGHEPRSGVWVEHSYARARGAAHAPAAHVRVLLAPRLSVERADVDVCRAEPPPPDLPEPPADPEQDDSDPECDDDWEARLTALAPSAALARLASHALDALRRMRLERLAGARGDTAARGAARRLRLALAAAAAHAPRPAAWLHAALQAHLPRAQRRLYEQLAAELRRAAPRLAGQAPGGAALPDPLAAVGPARGDAGPWLVWLGCGRARLDARWTRRLGALVHTRVLAGEAGGGGGGRRLAPDAWCAAVAGSVRAALADTLVEAGERGVILGGIGAGAALVTALAGAVASRVRGLLLLAPPLLTAGGARDAADDALWELRAPLLVVAGSGAAQCWRGAAREVAAGGAGGGGARRVLELRGADDALRLPAAVRRRRRLPQHALDAAVAEECARWVIETATHAGGESPARERPRRRDTRASLRAERPERPERSKRAERPERPERAERLERAADDEEEYAHLPVATRPAPPAPLSSAGSDRTMESVGESSARRGAATKLEASNSLSLSSGRLESLSSGRLESLSSGRLESLSSGRLESLSSGRLVSRGSGATPLALLPPRRRAPSPAAPALQAADILRLPIVFADDEPAPLEPPASPVTVTSGARAYTRVIVASRGGVRVRPGGVRPGAVRPGAVRPGAVRPGPVRPGAVRPARPVLLRRGLRLLQRSDRPH